MAPSHNNRRNLLQVPEELIAALSDVQLRELAIRLFRAEAYRCGARISDVVVSLEVKAPDKGCDGWTPRPKLASDWLGSHETCWQLKAGVSSEPAKLSGEVSKEIPRRTLTEGNRFVLVASGCRSGRGGTEKRLKVLIEEAKSRSLPTDLIDAFGAEALASWVNEHPAVALTYIGGEFDGLLTMDDWAATKFHQLPWQASPELKEKISALGASLNHFSGDLLHLHVKGQPGVGKTRLALELCQQSPWRDSVIYVQQSSAFRLVALINSCARQPGTKLTIVADEVQFDQLIPLSESVGLADGRIRLITIGHSSSPDARMIPAFDVVPLREEVMTDVIRGIYPAMPREHVDFVVRFADGYVRLATLAAGRVAHMPQIDVRGLLSEDDIRSFLDKILGDTDRSSLYVVAILSSVGWEGDVEIEGRTIAEHLELQWTQVKSDVSRFHRNFNIAPQGGRYRYISPTPLAIYLAMEAWSTFPEKLSSLLSVLPEGAAKAYHERIESMASNPQAGDFARAQLRFFFRLTDFMNEEAAQRWSALSAADPEQAARQIRIALEEGSVEDARQLRGRARRDIIWTLVRIAWRSFAFPDAVAALALLAEAENETWANNATGEFVAKYQIYLAGTALSYLQRLPLLDDLLARDRPALTSVVIKALSRVGNVHYDRTVDKPPSDEVPEAEWMPATHKQSIECFDAAVARLCDIARPARPELLQVLLDAARSLVMRLRDQDTALTTRRYFETLRDAYPASREGTRRIVAELINNEKTYWKAISPEELSTLESLHSTFEGDSLRSRLEQYIGQPTSEGLSAHASILARELLDNRDELSANSQWLMSPDAGGAWWLGRALAMLDTDLELADWLPTELASGDNLDLIVGYAVQAREIHGDGWFDPWVDRRETELPTASALICEIVRHAGITKSIARLLASVLKSRQLDHATVGRLAYGAWYESLQLSQLDAIIRALIAGGYSDTAAVLLGRRLEITPAELPDWDRLAIELVVTPELIRSHQTPSHYWKQIAFTLVPAHCIRITNAIFEQHVGETRWSARYGEAEHVLARCVAHDPAGFWLSLTKFINDPREGARFAIGFPEGLLAQIPPALILDWVREQPEDRAPIAIALGGNDISSDDTIISQIISQFGDRKRIANALFYEYFSGIHSGPTSAHWNGIAESLEGIAAATGLPKLRTWAIEAAISLRSMATREQQTEAEEELRGR